MRGLLKTYYQKNNQTAFGSAQGGANMSALKQDDMIKSAMKDSQEPYKRADSQDHMNDHDRPKTKEELKAERIRERQRLRVARAAERRENWISMNVNDPEFVQGFQQGALPLYHSDNLRFRDFSAPGMTGLTGSIPKTSLEKSALHKIPQYDHTDYDTKQPSNHNNFRPRDIKQETTSPLMKYTFKDEKERINQQLSSGMPKMSTEPLNTLLLVKPKWREHDQAKWVGGKEFQSMMSQKDQGWKPFSNVMQQYPEPFMDNKVQFRDTTSVIQHHVPLVSSSAGKRRNLSQIRTQNPNSQVNSAFKASPTRSNGSTARGENANFEDSPVHKMRHDPQMFDSTIPHDHTWYTRVTQSTSLRQKHHLNQSIKLRKNLQHKDSSTHFDIRAHIEAAKHENKDVVHEADTDREREIITGQGEPALFTPEKRTRPPSNKPLSPITQEMSQTPGNAKVNLWSASQQKKPPLPKKEQVVAIDKMAPDLAAAYLNNEFTNSYTNAWQYNVVVKAPMTYHNKNFEEKEELRESHILWEMDREKTYFRSAMERINPQQIKNQVDTEKIRRTNMMMSLNHNVMDKTQNVEHLSPTKVISGSLKKLPTNFSATKKSPFQLPNGGERYEAHDRTQSGFYNSSAAASSAINGGTSPIKLMSMTMPKGFLSPKNAQKKANEMNKSEIKDVVKSYFDKSPSTQILAAPNGGSPKNNQTPQPPQTAYSLTNEFVIQVGAFNSSPQK